MVPLEESLPFGRAPRVEGYISRVRVICRICPKKLKIINQ